MPITPNIKIFAAITLGLITTASFAQPLVSGFDSSTEGWTVETHANPSGSFALVGTFAPDFNITGGAPGGYISEVDPDNQWSFFRAPLAWSGDRLQYSAGWLHYTTRTDSDSFPDGRLVILVGNNGQRISCDLGIPMLNVWTARHVRLIEGPWHNNTSASGSIATQSQIDAILADLDALYIGLEFGADLLEERVGIDSVQLSDCIADFSGDAILNFFDISAFLSAFASQSPTADLNNDGVYNFFDVSAFLSAFTQGCP